MTAIARRAEPVTDRASYAWTEAVDASGEPVTDNSDG
jgi:hypothetical protein